jgi:hypothetical protein
MVPLDVLERQWLIEIDSVTQRILIQTFQTFHIAISFDVNISNHVYANIQRFLVGIKTNYI